MTQNSILDWDIEQQLIVSLPMPDGVELDRMVFFEKMKNKVLVRRQNRRRKTEFFNAFSKRSVAP